MSDNATPSEEEPTANQPAAPRCPDCDVAGIEHIVSTPSRERSRAKQPWFYVVHCTRCGHIYDTISKHSFSQPVTPNFVLPKPS